MGDLPAQRIDVRQQPVSQLVELYQRVAILAKLPDLAWSFRAVGPEDGRESPQLEHPGVQFLIRRILAAVGEDAPLTAERKRADVEGPIRNAGHAVIDARGDLFPVDVPVRADVSGPGRCRGPLLAGEGGPGENVDALLVGLLALVVVDGLGGEQRVRVEVPGEGAEMIVLHPFHLELFRFLRERVDDVGFGRIHPPSVNSLGEQPLAGVLPIQVVGRRIVDIVVLEPGPPHGRIQIAPAFHVLVNWRRGPQPAPDGNHEVEMLLVKLVDHLLGAGVFGFVEEHAPPHVVPTPVIPVLDEVVDGNAPLAVFLRDAKQFVARGVVLLALPIAVGPLAVQGSLSGELPVSGDGLIHGRAIQEVVIHVVGHVGPERHRIGVVGEDGLGVVVPEDPVSGG